MAKKKNQPTTVNNIQELNLEIDYDKLAEAIVKAQGKANENDDTVHFTKGTFAILTGALMKLIAVLGCFVVLFVLVYGTLYAINYLEWSGTTNIISNIATCAFIFVICLATVALAVMLFKSSKEMEENKDQHFIIAVFSALSSLIALIISLVALFKGV